MKKILNIRGLDCAACAAELEELLCKTAGVSSATVSYVMQKIVLDYEDDAALRRAIETANGFEEVCVITDDNDINDAQGTSVELDKKAKTVLRLEGLHCAACAATLENQIAAINGVREASVDFVGQRVYLTADNTSAIKKAIKIANGFEKVRVLNGEEIVANEKNAQRNVSVINGETNKNIRKNEANLAAVRHKKEAVEIIASAALFLAAITFDKILSFSAARVISYFLYAAAYLVCGWRVLLSTAKNAAKGRVFDENFLMTIASVGAVILGDFAEGAAVILLYVLGEWLQAVAVGSSRRNVADLMALKSESANLIRKIVTGEQKETETVVSVPPERLCVGDEVIVRAGEKIPCDGVLISDSAMLDTKSLTGEAEYRAVKRGEEMLSGCINGGEVFRMRVTKEYKNSAAARILDLMENSAAQKAQSEKFITKFSRYYTPIVCFAALAVAFLFPLYDVFFGGGYTQNLVRWIRSALNFLVISCPCAMIISVPLTYFCALGACAKNGVLVKGSTYLDALAKAKIFAFDKTGTLTKGEFSVVKINAAEPFTGEEVLKYAKAAESNSAHPIARAFYDVDEAEIIAKNEETAAKEKQNGKNEYKTLSALETAGKGVCAALLFGDETYEVACGTAEYLEERGVKAKRVNTARTTVYVSVNGAFAGSVELGDRLRETAKAAITDLKRSGVETTVILTGDTAERAESVAQEAGIDEWKAGLLPDEKLAAANDLKARGATTYVGDGINDAPVMAAADCSVSMGKLGAAAAVEASDVVLISDDLSALAKGRRTARKAQSVVKQNVAFSIICKATFLIGSLMGIVPLWLAVFADVGVMTVAVLNALRMLKVKI